MGIGLLVCSVALLCVRCCEEVWVFECCSGLGLSRALVVGVVKLVWVESAALGWAFLFLSWWERMVWVLRGWISGVQGW